MGNRRSYDNIYVINDYGGREAVRMSDDILTSILDYSTAIIDESHDIANDIQKQMLTKIQQVTPVRKYSTNTQVVKRIIVHRSPPAVPKAIRQEKAAKYQPGVTRESWKRLTTNNLGANVHSILQSNIGSNIRSDHKTRTIYAVRNTTRWSIIHLINFDHDTVAHKIKYIESSKGSNFVTEVQEWGKRELERRLQEILNER